MNGRFFATWAGEVGCRLAVECKTKLDAINVRWRTETGRGAVHLMMQKPYLPRDGAHERLLKRDLIKFV